MAAQITEQASRAWHIWQNQQRLFTPREAVDIQVPALVRQVQPPRRVVQLPEGHLSRAEAEKALKTANKAAEAAVLRAARLAALAGLDYQPPEAVSVDLYGIPDKVDGASLEQQAAAVEQARVLHGAEAWEDAPDRKLHLKVKDIRLSLKGKWLQLYWPDDNRWWPGQVLDVNVKNRNLHMLYETGEEEQDMDLMELIKNNEVAWLHSEDAYHEERTQHKQQQPPQQQGGASKKRKEAGESREPAQHFFIIKKKGLRLAGVSGLRAGVGGYTYLVEPLWWAGMITMIVGEVANFAAYAFAPAILVTPLGGLSIIVSAILAHYMLGEKLNMFGILGGVLCIVGSVTIVLHAPEEREVTSLLEVWQLAMQPGFLLYFMAASAATLFLIVYVAPTHGVTTIFVYIGICSIMGSLSVMSCKALGIAIKLTLHGQNQFGYPETYYCMLIVGVCVITQMNYLNKALDLFNTALVSPIYYVMFTTLTITASAVLFKDVQGWSQLATETCGFVTIVIGTFLLHATKDLDISFSDLSQLARINSAFHLASQHDGPGGGGLDLPLTRLPSSLLSTSPAPGTAKRSGSPMRRSGNEMIHR
ncbi:hypothetical protein WJX72_009789 [[Myrmecia] bisecta]|uniref:Probable magnesium transporter n=1 Tax=[Myrmecia] bisecta TaxID=41462 RepID=A0AAW1PKS8_9CHLO